jgi:hypothetical protein
MAGPGKMFYHLCFQEVDSPISREFNFARLLTMRMAVNLIAIFW